MRSLLPVLLVVLLTPAGSPARATRYELGQRLRAFEDEWDRVTDAAARKRALPHLKRATLSFFAFSQAEAARELDLARLSLRAENPPAEMLWAASCVWAPERRLAEPGDGELTVTINRLYPPRHDPPPNVRFRIGIHPADGGPALVTTTADLKDLPARVSLSLRGLKEGDHQLVGEILRGEKVLARAVQTLSLVERPGERLTAVEKALKPHADVASTDAHTARHLTALLKQLHDGATLETNFPAVRMFVEVEDLASALADGKPYHGKDRPGEFRLSLAAGRRAVPVRVQVPAGAKEGKPLPLVIALHGAGGSENLFFDGYGNGAAARLAAKRGWLLVAPRDGLAEGVLDELAQLYPVDRGKVFLIGHSQGAGQAVAAASRTPEMYAAVAALGGGGTVRESPALEKVAFFVGIGKEDFALPAARSLRRGLEGAKVSHVVYKEYDDIEHLVIVQESLPEVFAFLDKTAH